MGIGALLGEAASPWSLICVLLGLCFLWLAARMLERAWWAPRRLERALRAQGLCGTSYRFLTGDATEQGRLNKEAWSRPLPLSHDIVPRVAPFIHKTMQEYGKTCLSWFGTMPRVTITDPELVKEVLSNKFGHFEKPKINQNSKLLADGLFSYEREKWAKHRRILNPAFHAEKLKRMLPVFSGCCNNLISRWEYLVGSNGSYELDVWPELQQLTGDVISRTTFGSNYLEGRRIFELQAEQVERLMANTQKFFIPGYIYLPTKNNRRMHQNKNEMDAILRDMIGKREHAMKDGKDTNDDLLSLLLESNKKHADGSDESSLGMTTKDIIEECKLFYFAGMETTSVLLTWIMVVLSMHPDWQEHAREEVQSLFGKNKPNYDGLSHLKTVTMILYEVLRLYPPAIRFSRKTLKQMDIGGITYPPGVILELQILFIHHDLDIWGEDANEFKPERFAEGISKASKDQVAFFPFGWGPRICIGQNFALLEAKMALSMMLQRFLFELSPSYTHAPHTVVTLHPQHGAQIKLKAI